MARLLVVAFLLAFTGVALWKLLELGIQAFQEATFTRPSIARAVDPPPSTTSDPALEAVLRRAVAGHSGAVGVYVRHLGDGRSASLAGDRPFPAASLFKLPILVEVLKQHRLGRLGLEEELSVEPEQWTGGSGVLQDRVGERFAVSKLLELMIVESDNIAALVLLDRVGVDNVNETMAAMGLRETRLQKRVRAPDGGWTLPAPHSTSARDVGLLLETIATGRLVDPPTSEQALRLLEQPQDQAWLAQGLPWWAKLAHKWGDLPDARHDAGIVYTPRGSYVVVVLTEDADSPAEAARTIADVSRAVFQHFEVH